MVAHAGVGEALTILTVAIPACRMANAADACGGARPARPRDTPLAVVAPAACFGRDAERLPTLCRSTEFSSDDVGQISCREGSETP